MRTSHAMLGALAGLWLDAALAAEPPALLAECADCHGALGQSLDPSVPMLAGLSADTFIQAMTAYRKQQRPPHPLAFPPYSKAELAQMGEFFAALAFVPAKQPTQPEMAARGRQWHSDYCEKCHEDQGRTDKRGVSILAGQWMPYLRQTLSDYRERKREMPKAMRERFDAMLEARGGSSLEDLVHYYGSLGGE